MDRLNPERLVLTVAILLSALFLFPQTAATQQASGTLRGTVRSPRRDAIAGASVSAKNAATGQTHAARSNERGQFEIRNLPPGVYEVEVTQPGFALQKRPAVEVSGGEARTVEIVLEPRVGSNAETPAARISEAQLVGLPLNGRSYNQLATLQAGVADTAGEQSSRGVGGGSLTVAGGRSTSNHFLLDGTTIMDTANRVPRSAGGVQLGADAIYQVQVLSANYGAEYGRGSGGTLNSVTSSGSNQFHATLFEYFRNSKLDAANFFDNASGLPKPPFKRNQFGFTLAGPLRKDQTFGWAVSKRCATG